MVSDKNKNKGEQQGEKEFCQGDHNGFPGF
jgi:hypothetical protein